MSIYIALTINVLLFLMNSFLGAAMLMLTVLLYLFFKKERLQDKLVYGIAYAAPFYAFSFYGGRERLSLCTVLVLLFFVYILAVLTRRLLNSHICFTSHDAFLMMGGLISFLGYLISALESRELSQMLWDTYHCLLLVFAIISVRLAQKNGLIYVDPDKLLGIIVAGVCAIAGGVYFQFVLQKALGITVGYVFITGSTRYVYNLYFYAKSVLSMYLSIGGIYYFILMYKNTSFLNILKLSYIMGALLLNNSRTGLVCFLISAMIYVILHMKKTMKNMKIILFLFIAMILGVYVVDYMLSTRSKLTGLLDDNGRFDLIKSAVLLLPKYLVAGIGGTALDYASVSIGTIIHNFFLQALLQFGCIGGMAMCGIIYSRLFCSSDLGRYYVLVLLVGSMFFAHWQNAVVIIPVFMMAEIRNNSMLNNRDDNQVVKIDTNHQNRLEKIQQ